MSHDIMVHQLYKNHPEPNEPVLLQAIDLQVSTGSSLLITGPSGSGKTTLLHVLAGLEGYQQGQLMLLGHDMASVRPSVKRRLWAEKIGFLFQFHHLLPGLTVRENIELPLVISGQSSRWSFADLFALLGLSTALLERSSTVLSGGEKQRVALARALIHKPAIVFADEPTGCLDQGNAALLWQLLLQVQADLKTTLVVVSHDLSHSQQTMQHARMQDGCLFHEKKGENG